MTARRIQPLHQAVSRQRGWMALLVSVCLGLVVIGWLLWPVPARTFEQEALRRTDAALAEAKEGLLAFAGAWPRRQTGYSDDPLGLLRGPGLLPCPDRNDNGHADDGSCGGPAGTGTQGQRARLGRLPFLTLGLPDLRDGSGNRLWYAVSSKYKSLESNPDLSPDTGLGTISVRDVSGALIHDGRLSAPSQAMEGGVVAVILAPGPPIARWLDRSGSQRQDQQRNCTAAGCDSTPENWLDLGWFAGGAEDNAKFKDPNVLPRTDNADGFIQGPLHSPAGELVLNDRIAFITHTEIQQVMMRRVATEVAGCLQQISRVSGGRLPFPAPVCRSGRSDAGIDWREEKGFRFGRLPQPPFTAAQSVYPPFPLTWPNSSAEVCRLDSSDTGAWWRAWRLNVFVLISERALPTGEGGACSGESDPTCLLLRDSLTGSQTSNVRWAVIVSGAPLGTQSRIGPARQRTEHYLEGIHAGLERNNVVNSPSECLDLPPALKTPVSCPGGGRCPDIQSTFNRGDFNDFVLPAYQP